MVRLGGPGSGGGGDSNKDGDGDKNEKKGRPSTPVSIAEVGDSNEEATPVILSSIFISRFQQEVGDAPSELVLTPFATPTGSRQSGSIAEFHTPTGPGDSDVDVEVQSNTNGFGSSSNDAAPENDASDGVDASLLGAAAAPPPPTPSPLLRRQPTPDEAARYAEVARQLNEVARQIEADYSDDLDQLVESLNLVSEVAYDAFAAVARTIISKGITFSRVLVLILFGWRVLKKVYSSGILGFFQRFFEYILKFITDNVLSWVLAQGGWTNLLRNPPPLTPSADRSSQGFPLPSLPGDVFANLSTNQALGFAAAFGAVAVAAYYLFGNRR